MPEQIISASGTQYGLVINPDGSINVGGISIGSVTLEAGSESWVKEIPKTEVYGSGTFIGSITSMPSINVSVGSESYVPAGSVIITNIVTGSITSMPEVSVSTGSESWIKNFGDLGSSRVITNLYAGSNVWEQNIYPGSKLWQGERFGVSGIVEVSNRVAGSIVNIPSIVGSVYVSNQISEITVGSETYNYIKSGTVWIEEPEYRKVLTSGTLPISGIVDTQLYAGSETWIKAGSVQIDGGSVYVTNFTAGTGYAGSDAYIPAGSVIVTNTVQTAGSIWSIPSIEVAVGSESWIKGGSIQTYTPLGSTYVTGSVFATGSVNIATDLASIGSWTGYTGSIWSMPDISVTTGSEQYIMNFADLGSTVVVDNLYTGSNSYIPAGSVIVTNNVAIANPETIGSLAVQTVDGTVTATTGLYAGSDAFIPAGSVIVTNTVSVSGNVLASGTISVGNLYAGSQSYGYDFGDRFIQQIDYQAGNAPIYLGFATPSTATSFAGWQLRKLGYSGGLVTSILFGSGNTSFDKVWNNRSGTGEVYS